MTINVIYRTPNGYYGAAAELPAGCTMIHDQQKDQAEKYYSMLKELHADYRSGILTLRQFAGITREIWRAAAMQQNKTFDYLCDMLESRMYR